MVVQLVSPILKHYTIFGKAENKIIVIQLVSAYIGAYLCLLESNCSYVSDENVFFLSSTCNSSKIGM